MRILVTNDDGIDAPGINILTESLIEAGHEVTVVAPDIERSASSHSITLRTPLRILEKKPNRYAVTGSPADCVIVALEVIVKDNCDLVVSGINRGPNLGEDILYSGTVAAAIEAMYFGYPALAVSSTARLGNHYGTAAHYIVQMIRNGIKDRIAKDEIININVPAVHIDEIKGIKLTRTGQRYYKEFIHAQKDPWGKSVYWIGGDKPEWIEEENTDFAAVADNYISLSPIAPKFTQFSSFKGLDNWLEKYPC
jgi:5'-nucleotidase